MLVFRSDDKHIARFDLDTVAADVMKRAAAFHISHFDKIVAVAHDRLVSFAPHHDYIPVYAEHHYVEYHTCPARFSSSSA